MFSAHGDGTTVEIWVVPGASQDEIVGVHDGAIKVRVSAPAEGGKATRAVKRLISSAVPGHRVTVVSGALSRRKRVVIAGIDPETARSLLLGSET
jgi:uncharacterized protein